MASDYHNVLEVLELCSSQIVLRFGQFQGVTSATARKLVTIAWHMLKNNEPYRYAQPKTIQAKLSRLRIRVTGRKKKGGAPKGQPRSTSYGSGTRTRAVPALDALYAQEQLPPLSIPKPGELAMLRRHHVDTYARHIRQPRRVPRGSQ